MGPPLGLPGRPVNVRNSHYSHTQSRAHGLVTVLTEGV